MTDTSAQLIAALASDAPLLMKLIGCTVHHAVLDIWPSPTWPEDTDTRLNLGVNLPSGDQFFLTFRQTSAGVSDIVEERIDSETDFSSLGKYLELWNRPEFWDKDEPTQRLRVSLAGETEFGRLLGVSVEFAEIVFDYPETYLVGYLIGLRNGARLWSTPCTDGNSISSAFSRKFIGNEQLVKVRIDETTL